jgi:hypothetical protein
MQQFITAVQQLFLMISATQEAAATAAPNLQQTAD